jgi:hypothetical protein
MHIYEFADFVNSFEGDEEEEVEFNDGGNDGSKDNGSVMDIKRCVGIFDIEPDYRENQYNAGDGREDDAFSGDLADLSAQFFIGKVKWPMVGVVDGKSVQVVQPEFLQPALLFVFDVDHIN